MKKTIDWKALKINKERKKKDLKIGSAKNGSKRAMIGKIAVALPW